MGEIIYDKLVYGRELTPEQWSKLKYRPLDDTDMYGIAENPSFGIDKSLIGGGNYMEMFYDNPDFGNINVLCALFNIEVEHEEHQYLVEYEHREQVYENTDEVQIPYLFVGPNYTGQDTPTATLSADDWNDLISGRAVQFGFTKTGEEEPYPTIQDGSKTYDVNYWVGGGYYEIIVDTYKPKLNALNANGLLISGIGFTLDNLSVTRPITFDTADFTKISLSKMAPSIYEEYLPINYMYIKEPFSIDNGENDYMIYGNHGEDYLVSFNNSLGKFYTSPQSYSTPNVEVFPECVGMGTVSVSPQKSSYEALSEITMTANANEGYMFAGWAIYDGELTKENSYTDRVSSVTYYALFGKPVTITLEAEPAEGGTVSGGGTYASGSNVILTATPNEGYIFDGWWEGETQRTDENESEWLTYIGSKDTTYTAKFSSPENRKLTYTTNSDAGEIYWIAENCIDGTYSHDENGGQAILKGSVNILDGFMNNEKLTSINIPESITSIYGGTFSYCTNLTSISLPSSLYSIEDGAFYNCTKLTSIELPSGLYSIKGGAFDSCTSLTSIDLPSSLGEIESNAFANCTSLADVYCYIETTAMISIGAIADSIFKNIAENPTLHVPASVLTEYQNPSYGYDYIFGENIVAITE